MPRLRGRNIQRYRQRCVRQAIVPFRTVDLFGKAFKRNLTTSQGLKRDVTVCFANQDYFAHLESSHPFQDEPPRKKLRLESSWTEADLDAAGRLAAENAAENGSEILEASTATGHGAPVTGPGVPAVTSQLVLIPDLALLVDFEKRLKNSDWSALRQVSVILKDKRNF
jgi:hypothetical protein